MRRSFIIILALFASHLMNGQVLTVKTLMASMDQPEVVKTDATVVTAFFKKWYIMETNIASVKIEKKNKRYILLAYDSQNNRTLATRLTIQPEGLYLTALYNLYGCECNCMDLGKFKFIKNKITGCIEGDLTIATAY